MTNQNNNNNGKKTIEDTEAEKKHAVNVENLMKEVQAMYRRNAHLFPNGDPIIRASSGYIPRTESDIRIGDMQSHIFPSDTREKPTWKPVTRYLIAWRISSRWPHTMSITSRATLKVW